MFAQVRYAEDLNGSTDTLVEIGQPSAIGFEGADAVGPLNAILQVGQHTRHHRRHIDRPGVAIGAALGSQSLGQPVQHGDVALAMQGFAQFMPPHCNRQII